MSHSYTDTLKLFKRAGLGDLKQSLSQLFHRKDLSLWQKLKNAATLSTGPIERTLQNRQGLSSWNQKNINLAFLGAMQGSGDSMQSALKLKGEPYQLYTHNDFNQAFADAVRFRADHPRTKITVYGHSMGGKPAAKLAHKLGDNVQLVLQDPVNLTRTSLNVPQSTQVWYPGNTSITDPKKLINFNNLEAGLQATGWLD